MKKCIRYLTVFILIAGLVMPGFGFDKSRQVGFTISGGFVNNAHGGFFAPSHTMSEVLDAGTNLNVGVSYGLSEIFRLEALVDYSFASFDDEIQNAAGRVPFDFGPDPTYSMMAFKLRSITHLNPVLGTGNVISPFVTFGAGIYSLRITDDGLGGDTIPSPHNSLKNVSKTAFGLNAGVGVEFYLTPTLALIANGKYDLVMTDDSTRFGPDFRDQGFFSIDLGFNFYITMF